MAAEALEGTPSATDKKTSVVKGDIEASSGSTREAESDKNVVLQNEREIATHVISVDDDPSLSPWTFRAVFIGLGLSAFGGSLGKAVNIIQSRVLLTCYAS
jgi:hypothetical protein